ncbi:MAG: 50S ribosomal protein L18e [Promethearchaeota archaeon]
MVKTTGPTDPNIITLIRLLKKTAKTENAPIWKRVAAILSNPRRTRPEVNLSVVNRHSKKGETVLVPGKVLGAGTLEHSVTIAAVTFSGVAQEKIKQQGGNCISILDLLTLNPNGSNIRLLK